MCRLGRAALSPDVVDEKARVRGVSKLLYWRPAWPPLARNGAELNKLHLPSDTVTVVLLIVHHAAALECPSTTDDRHGAWSDERGILGRGR